MLQPQIVLLREGTDTSQGKAQLISNINACQAVVDVVRTTLGPRGMDKLIHDDQGNVTISNDGATSVVLLAGEFLRECKSYVEEGVHPQVIVKAYREACRLAIEKLGELSVKLTSQSKEELREMLVKSAATSLS